MSCSRLFFVSGTVLCLSALLVLSACGGAPAAPVTSVGPTGSYTLAATALNPGSVIVGGKSTSTITVTPANGYTGSVSLSCSSITGGTPPPTCSFSVSPIAVGGTAAGTSTLTVSTSSGTAGGSYAITVAASDAKSSGSSNGPQSLALTIPGPSYTLTATALSPGSVTAGGAATSTVTVTPVNGYTGSVNLSCSSTSGTPPPTCSFSPSSIVIGGPAGTSTLTVTTGGSAIGGSYTVSVTGSDAQGLAPSDGPQALALTTVGIIQHVVIIFQENRSTDNMFQDPVLIKAGADIASSGVNSLGQVIPLSPIGLGTGGSNPDAYDLAHSHKSFGEMCDLNSSTGVCAMDGADLIFVTCNPGAPNCPPSNPQFMYVDPADVQPYFQMAEQYTFADRMFQTNQGPSYPAHQFIISGTSAPQVGSDLFVMDNPHGIPLAGSDTGCTSPAGEYVEQIDPDGNQISTYPCFEHQTLPDLLDAASLSWRYYTPTAGSIWTAPNSIEHLCGPNAPPPNATACIGPDWIQNVVLSPPGQTGQVLTDIANGQLASPSWVASVVNAIGASPYWQNTAIFVLWDDWGGFYDHVAPPMLNSYEYGFRVPMIVVSAYAKPAYISRVTHDFGSILKFTEEALNLPSLGYADVAADDLADCFNFSQTPIAFQTIDAPLKADYFLNDKRPVTDPDND